MEKPQYQTFIKFFFILILSGFLQKQDGQQSLILLHQNFPPLWKISIEWALADTSQANAVMHY